MEGLVEIAELGEQPVIAELLAVIGGEDDERAVVCPARLEMVDEATNLGVNLAHHAVVSRPQLARIGLAEQQIIGRGGADGEAAALLVANVVGEPGVLFGLVVRARRPHRRWHVGRIVERVVGLGRDERRMRRQE